MSGSTLIRMANEIAANFGGLAEDEAVAETASHIRRFWEPRMREELVKLIAENKAEALSPIARRAVENFV